MNVIVDMILLLFCQVLLIKIVGQKSCVGFRRLVSLTLWNLSWFKQC